MAIFRGIGGAGDSDTDATVTAVTQQAVNAANSATSAAASASSASSSATGANASATAASSSAASASTSAALAATSASNASASASSANTSAANALASETAAGASETAAAASESAAATSASNAASSASSASFSASTATTKASEASASASAAATSASNAATSATNASASQSAAATSASNAATSETNAASSASTASSSASAASASETAAAASETAAATSASNAATSETNAASSASTATTQAGIASSAATTATTQASNASTSASNAATSASNAASSASSAASSASSASASADAALAALDSFDDRYLGQKASAPTLDNDGNALIAGALYFNTTTNEMKVYDGSTWLNAYASLSGALLATNNLSDLNNVATAITNLGLAASATTDTTNASNISSGTLSATRLADSGVTAATYGDANNIPQITVDAKGRVTSASTNSISVGNGTLTLNTSGTGISGSQTFTANQAGNATFTVTSNATNLNTASTVVARDASGDFSAGTITAALSGNASTAATLQTARTIALSGAATGTATSFDGGANITIPVTALNASNLSSGTVPDARISGSYTGMTNLTGSGTVDFAKFLGNAADTAAAPSISWTGDTNTGIYRPGTDQVGITTGGTGRLTVSTTDVTSTLPITATDLYPSSDNTGVVGSSALTWSNGQFTNLSIDSTLTVRGAIDLADSDMVRLGSSDDWKLWYNGSTNKGQIEMESTCNGIQFTNNGAEVGYFDKTGVMNVSTIKADNIETLAGVSTSMANAVNGSAKAWVNFNGTGTVAIRRAFNVSSITDNGTGKYTVNFTTAMPDANYAAVVGTVGDSSPYNQPLLVSTATYTASSVQVFNSPDYSLNAQDSALMTVAVFS